MYWFQLKDLAVDYKLIYIQEHNPTKDYHGISVLSSMDANLSPDYIYVCKASRFQNYLKKSPRSDLSFLLYADVLFAIEELPTDFSGNLMVLSKEKEVSLVYNESAHIIQEEMTFRANFNHFLATIRTNAALDVIADEISNMYRGNIVFIVNPTYSLITSSNPSHKFDRLNKDEAQGRVSLPALSSVYSAKADSIHVGSNVSLLFHPDAPFKNYHTPIYQGSITIGYLDLFTDKSDQLSHIEISYLNTIADLLSHKLRPAESVGASDNISSALFSAILEGEYFDNEQILQRMQHFGYNLQTYKRIIVSKTFSYDHSDGELANIARSLIDLFGNSIYVIKQQTIVFLHSYKENLLTPERFREWELILKNNNIKIGISMEFTDLSQAPRAFSEAMQAFEVGRICYPQNPIYQIESLKMHYMMKQLSEVNGRSSMMSFCHPAILELLKYDQQHDAQFLETLYLLLRYPNDLQKICDALHIHRNTLYSRIKKIHSFIPEDFNSINLASQIYITLLILSRADSLYFDMEQEIVTNVNFETDS